MRDLALRESSKPDVATVDIDLSFIDEGQLDEAKVQQLIENGKQQDAQLIISLKNTDSKLFSRCAL